MLTRITHMLAWPGILLVVLVTGCPHGGGGDGDPSMPPGEAPGFPLLDHVDQGRVLSGEARFEELFLDGDLLFSAPFNGLDGSGALLLPDGTSLPSRFSRIPPGGGRFTGPNGNACISCHNTPLETSAGEVSGNVLQDPAGLGVAGVLGFNPRNPTSLFGSGALQPLAEEMTEALHALRDAAKAEALSRPVGTTAARDLVVNGVSFGRVGARHEPGGTASVDTSAVEGIDGDLVVRPYGWKGNVTTLRDFVRGACRDELGMEPVELVAKDPLHASDPEGADPDGDGVSNELSVGDVTALTIYMAGQEIPATTDRLVRLGQEPPPPAGTGARIARGRALLDTIGCTACHVPEMRLQGPVFRDPSPRGGGAYVDAEAVALGVDPAAPATAHMVREGDLPRLEPHPQGGAVVALFGDLKRHRMGRRLADAQETPISDASGRPLDLGAGPLTVPRDVFLTAELWGVGDTGPWLHDGRAGTLEDAILLHGEDAPPAVGDPDRSEAQEARDAFAALSAEDRLALVEFLRSLRTAEIGGGE